MRIDLKVGDILPNTLCQITEIYPNFIICKTVTGRKVTFNIGDYVSNRLDWSQILEEEDNYLLDYDCGRQYRV